MTKITAAGLYSARSGNEFAFLNQKAGRVDLAFSGAALASTVEVGTLSESGDFVLFPEGAVTALPDVFVIESVPSRGIAINVVGGSPDFSVAS